MLLSILICSLNKRRDSLKRLLDTLGYFLGVEILVEVDDGQVSTGVKRNILLKKAKGKYVVFIDDDDTVVPSYIQNIVEALRSEPDVVGFSGYITTDNKEPVEWRISKDYNYVTTWENGRMVYLRYNNHLSPVKREIALAIGYPDLYYREDYDYARRLHESGLIKTEVVIPKHLYFYEYKTTK